MNLFYSISHGTIHNNIYNNIYYNIYYNNNSIIYIIENISQTWKVHRVNLLVRFLIKAQTSLRRNSRTMM